MEGEPMEKSGAERHRIEIMTLEAISKLFGSQVELPRVVQEIVEKTADRMGLRVCSIYLLEAGRLVLRASCGLHEDAVGKVSLKVGEGITGHAAKEMRAISVKDAANDPRFKFFPGIGEERYKAMLSIPVAAEDQLFGVINVQTVKARDFEDDEVAFLETIANILATALKERRGRLNPFATAQAQLDRAAERLRLDPDIHTILREPKRELHVSLPIRMDDGTIKVFQGFRVQYNDACGPTKGGLRFHPDETIDTVKALAAWMTWKCALVRLPLGGGKGGIICNPKEMSQGELEKLSRDYIRKIAEAIGPDKDIPAPDVYTNPNPEIMAWMMDEFSKLRESYRPGVITGKPLALGGSPGREDATARGGVFVIREAAKYLSINLAGATVAVQGYGNAGYFAAILMEELMGSKIVAVSDSRGGIYDEGGLDPRAVLEHKMNTGSVIDFPGARPVSNPELLELAVDVLIPSGLENVITVRNAGRIQARIVGELANGPTTLAADQVLFDNEVFVLPDFLCNAGGVTVSYFEWVQNLNRDQWAHETVEQKLDQKMTQAFYDVIEVYEREKDIDMRMAAYMVAVSRVAETMKLRGLPI
jgi:glutamate dehydrogenase (NAD(P)+)